MLFLPWFCVEEWLKGLDNDGHIRSEISFVLHTQCRNCRQLNCSNTICMLGQSCNVEVAHTQTQKNGLVYLCNSLRWILIV